MKYQTFVLIRNTVVVAVVGLGGFALVKGCRTAEEPPATVAVAPPVSVSPPAKERAPEPAATGAAGPIGSTPSTPSTPSKPSTPSTPSTPGLGAAARTENQPLLELHREILEMARQPLSSGASGMRRVKQGALVIELRSDGSTSWDRIKLDLDGDKSWDEAWDLKPDRPVKRRVALQDDENYTATFDLKDDQWVRREK